MKKLLIATFLLFGGLVAVQAQTASDLTQEQRMEQYEKMKAEREAMAKQKAEIAERTKAVTGKEVNAKYTSEQKQAVSEAKKEAYYNEYKALLEDYKAKERVATSSDERARLNAAIQELEEKLSKLK